MVPIKLARLKANGKRYICIRTDAGKVYCQGAVLHVQGHSAKHGMDRIFLMKSVDIIEVDLSEELLRELMEQERDVQPRSQT